MDDFSRHQRGLGRHDRPRGGHVANLAAGYALGALDADERTQVERHRRACPECDRLLAREERVVGLLPFLVSTIEAPPPDLKVALLARVAHSMRAAEANWAPERATPPTIVTIPASRPRPVPVVSPPAGTRARRSPHPWGGWATAVLVVPLLLALAVTGAFAYRAHAEAEERGDRANGFGQMLERALAGEGAISELSPGPAAPEAKGWVVTDAGRRSATLFLRNPEAGAGHRYRILATRQGPPVALAEVELDGRGRGVKTFALDLGAAEYRQFRLKLLIDDEAGAETTKLALFGPIAAPSPTPSASGATRTPTGGAQRSLPATPAAIPPTQAERGAGEPVARARSEG